MIAKTTCCTAALACLLAMGCASSGRPFDIAHAGEVRTGQAEAMIVGWFGDPFTKEDLHGSTCTKRWIWYRAPSQVLFVDFDDNGRVCR